MEKWPQGVWCILYSHCKKGTNLLICQPREFQMLGKLKLGDAIARPASQSSERNSSCHLTAKKNNRIRVTRKFVVLHQAWSSTWNDTIFYCWKSRKNVYFHSKMAWPPATYDVISRNHRNWPSLNLTQNAREGWKNSYWKHQVLMFYLLGKNSEKP